MRRRLMASTLVAASALGVTAGVTALRDPGRGESAYVAMGDSFSSGARIAPLTPAPNPRCSRSQLNYAQVIVQRTASDDVTDVSCSGARTEHFRTSQFPGIAPQLEALTDKTRLVTMTIGANDKRVFGKSITACVALSSKKPSDNPCEQRFGDVFQRRISQHTYPNLVRTLTEVRDAAPRAQIAVVGYPRLLPGKASTACTTATRVAQGDVAYLNSIQARLNSAVRRASRAAGVTYVDMSRVSAGHDACQSPERRWIEPFVPVNAASFHPNANGEAAMAAQIIQRLHLAS